MPLEIREMAIRLHVGDAGQAAGAAAEGASDGAPTFGPAERAALVEGCVHAVLDALRRQSER
jgi:hypothetical protein